MLIKNGDDMSEWETTEDFKNLVQGKFIVDDDGETPKWRISESTETFYDDGVPRAGLC